MSGLTARQPQSMPWAETRCSPCRACGACRTRRFYQGASHLRPRMTIVIIGDRGGVNRFRIIIGVCVSNAV